MERGWKPSVDQVSPACPRCGSSNTKFCYYNNYSLTQPRYFCKGCRRYWTKGGSLRNVPIGGGCRKSRRGKSSIRVSSGASSRLRLAHNGNDQPCSSFSSLGGPDDNNTNNTPSTSIDLAAVYANFLNQKPPQFQSGGPEMPDHGTHVVVPPVEFSSSFHQLSNSHFHQEISTGFLDCGPYSGGLSETSLLGDRSSMFFCGLDSFQKQRRHHHHQQQQQHMTASGSNFSMPRVNPTSNVSLPPLPGLDIVAASEGLLTWPGEDLMLPSNQMLRETTTMSSSRPVVGPAEENSELLSGNMSTFGVLNLEAIFRS